MVRALITGTGRCGTATCAAILRAHGIHASHQDIYRHEHTLGVSEPDWGDYQVAVSFEAVPMLDPRHPFTVPDVPVVLLLRHPLKVIESWLSLGAFGNNMRRRFPAFWSVLQIYVPNVLAEPSPVDRAAVYWETWNRLAVMARPVISVEVGDWGVIFDLLGRRYDPAIVETVGVRDEMTPDRKTQVGPVGWEDLSPPVAARVRGFARDSLGMALS